MRLDPLFRRFLDSGSDDAWKELITAVVPLLSRIVYRISTQRGQFRHDLLEDVLQETLLKLHSQRNDLRERLSALNSSEVEPYFKAVAANAARDFWRSQRVGPKTALIESEQDVEISLDSLGISSPPGVERDLVYSEIDQALGSNRRDRTTFWLYYRWGYKAREIASIPALALTEKGVESLLHRTAQRIRRRLTPKAEDRKSTRRPDGP